MRAVKLILKWLGYGLLALVVVIGILVASDFTFWKRYGTMTQAFGPASVTNVAWYQPQETVKGGVVTELAVATDAERTVDPAVLETVKQWLDARRSVAFIVWHKGKIQYEHYWPGFSAETRTSPASMHKSVMAILMGQAIAEGKIAGLDIPASTYLTEWKNDARRDITIRQLLHMASGLDRYPFSLNPFSGNMKVLYGSDMLAPVTEIAPWKKPDEIFEYNNLNSQALGIVIERAVGERYASYLSRALWSKLGTGDAAVWLDREGGLPRTYCCLFTTARDWVKVGLLLLNQGRVGGEQVVPADWIAQMTTPSPLNPNYGFQVWLGTVHEKERSYGQRVRATVPTAEPFAVPGIVYFDGAGGQRVYVIPSAEMVIVRTGGPNDRDWDDSYLPNTLLRAVREVTALPAAMPAEGAPAPAAP
jgi:CubicO group peptidase (beta-lactamase class C family)